MAKKESEKFVRLVLPESVHDRLRMAAAQAKMSMAAFCAAAAEKMIDETLRPKPAKKERP
jgi:predicted HicB family RNase H-like nuclease